MSEPFDWRSRFPGDVTCVRCLEAKHVRDLDRLLWCEACRERAGRRAAARGWTAAVAVTLTLAAYIWLVIRPDMTLIPAAWGATLIVALYLTQKVARELFYGLERIRNRKATEAAPPRPDDQAAE